jgi:two-component system NtrC family response regulator
MSEDSISILVVDDEPSIRSGLAKGLAAEAATIETAKDGDEAMDKFKRLHPQIVITDVRLPGSYDGLELVECFQEQRPETVVIVITAFGTIETAVKAMRRGAHDFVTKPVDLNVIRQHVQKAVEFHRLKIENRQLRDRLAKVGDDPELVGNSTATQQLLGQIRQVAETDAIVLIHGESGTGKELTARAIHRYSSRANAPFVPVNLGALPETLLESELFGYEKGAFTGANRRKPGHIEAAAGGTLFLDEITETSPRSQVDLLRVLEERQFQRLGGDELLQADVRFVSATNKDIAELVAKGEFREDLYYRLNVVPIRIPPLRQRREDIPLMVDHFLEHYCRRHGRGKKQIAPEALHVIVGQSWPGNVRQLRNVIERLVVTIPTDVIHGDDLPLEMRTEVARVRETLATAVEEAEKCAIQSALSQCENHRERTATLLDISIRSLHYKMSRYGLH